MENKEILEHLSKHRDKAKFAKYLGISARQIYNLLNSDKPQHRQEGNFIDFVVAEYIKEDKKTK